MRLLVVEDHEAYARAIARGLRNQGFAVDVAYDGLAASQMATATRYDVVVLDRDLPVRHGDDVCRELAGGTTRILMLTASGGIDDRVQGLELGADDYLAKPFAFVELVARVRALARRSQPALPPVLASAGIELDSARRRVTRDGSEVRLTPKEFGVLQALLAAGGAVVSAETLLERVWDENVDELTNSVRVVVSTLRRKLGDPDPIESLRGAGYRLQ